MREGQLKAASPQEEVTVTAGSQSFSQSKTFPKWLSDILMIAILGCCEAPFRDKAHLVNLVNDMTVEQI
jgi:hypothetical protein